MRHEKKEISDIHKATRLYKSVSTYTAFFRHRIYTGDLEYGGKLYENFVEPLIPRQWWEEEQERIKARAEKLKGRKIAAELEPRRVASRHLLTGLVFCGAADSEEHPMLADSTPANEKRSQWDYYICSFKKNSRNQRCQARRVGAQALTEAVIEKLLTEVLTHANLRPIADELAKSLAERNQDAVLRITAARGELDEVRAAISKLMDALETSGFSPSIQRRLTEREAEEHQLLSEIANLEAMMVKPVDIPKVTDKQIDDFIASIKATLTSDDIDLARQALRRFVAKIVVNEKAGTIFYTFPLQDLSRKGMMPPQGYDLTACLTPLQAVHRVLARLYQGLSLPTSLRPYSTQKQVNRNEEIRQRYAAGESLGDLAKAYGLSKQRIHQIVSEQE